MTKIKFFHFMLIFMLFFLISISAITQAAVKGDVDNSQTVSLSDAIKALQIAAGLSSSNIRTDGDVNGELKRKIQSIQEKLDRVRQSGNRNLRVIQKLDNSEKRLDGWSIQKSKDGYYRGYRKVNKKLHSVYLGKTFEFEKARLKIAEKEKRLGLNKG